MKMKARLLDIKQNAKMRMDDQRASERAADLEAEKRMSERMASRVEETPAEQSARLRNEQTLAKRRKVADRSPAAGGLEIRAASEGLRVPQRHIRFDSKVVGFDDSGRLLEQLVDNRDRVSRTAPHEMRLRENTAATLSPK